MEDNELPLSQAPPQPAAEKGPSREEWESLQRQMDELRQSERYWAERARSGGKAEEPAPGAAEEGPDPNEFLDPNEQPAGIEGDSPEQLVNEFAENGIAALHKRGFITAADAKRIAVEAALHVSQELINRERHKMGTDQQLITRYPDLLDDQSDLFKETAPLLRQAIAMDPRAQNSIAVLTLAAEAASQKLKNRKPREEDEYEAPRRNGRESEERRQARIAAQDGRSNGRQLIDDVDTLGSEAAEVVRKMNISPEQFLKSRKESGLTVRRRR